MHPIWIFLVLSFTLLTGCGSDEQSASSPTQPTPTQPTPTEPPSASTLIALATTFPAMPKELTELLGLEGRKGTSATFASGLPLNDIEYTLFDTDYMDGETNGFDLFMPVDPSRAFPGADTIKISNMTTSIDLDTTYSGQGGDRLILGTAEIAQPFFLRGEDNLDNDYVVVTNFNYTLGYIQLRGSASDYGLIFCGLADGCATAGYYLFYVANPNPDLVAFVFPCDDVALPLSDTAPQNPRAMCNDSGELELSNMNQFRFAAPVSVTVAVPNARVALQFGSTGKEVIGGVTTDAAGNMYSFGLSDGNLDGGATADNEIFVVRFNLGGTQAWVKEFALPDGSLFLDAVADGEYLYAVGRTLGALEGFTNQGRWDAIILKLRLSDGTLVAANQFGNSGLDGYGNVVLDDSGHLYVSGAGSPEGATGTDDSHLVAKHRTSDLGNVWRQIVSPVTTGKVFVSEAWGGLSYVAGDEPGRGRLVAGGWYMSAGGANGFLEIWENLTEATPLRTASAVIASPGREADWILDNVVDEDGNVYAVGYTTGDLQGTHQGNGDAFIVRYDATLQNPVFVQVGTAQSDAFRRLESDPSGNLYATGYSYGDYDGPNADPTRETGDVIVQKFARDLKRLAAVQLGTPHEDRGYVHLRSGLLYVGGMTEAALAGPNQGSFDGFIVGVDAQTMEVAP